MVQRAKVVFTLITPLRQGRGFRREALGGGTWKSTGAESIASREVVLSKLYYKRDDGSKGGFTVFEFHLTADHQLKVCVGTVQVSSHAPINLFHSDYSCVLVVLALAHLILPSRATNAPHPRCRLARFTFPFREERGIYTCFFFFFDGRDLHVLTFPPLILLLTSTRVISFFFFF